MAVASPATIIDPAIVDNAAEALRSQGFDLRLMPHVKSRAGTFAGTRDQRLADLSAALLDSEVKAVMCSRGGYGCMQLLDGLAALPLADNPKWLIGFSDVTALHSLMLSKGIVSIHSSMLKSWALNGPDFPSNKALMRLLGGATSGYDIEMPPDCRNHPGEATGQLVGGNLAVLQALVATPYDIFRNCRQRPILFIEDISEAIYKVNRIMWQLKMAGIFDRVGGLIFGQFTNYQPDANYPDMYAMLADFFADADMPIAFNAPVGHFPGNMPLLHGAEATLIVNRESSSSLTFL